MSNLMLNRRSVLLGASSALAMPSIAKSYCDTGGMFNAVYFQNDGPGQVVSIAGRGGRQITLWNPDASAYETRCIQTAGGQPGGVQQAIFNGTAYVDGIPNQSLEVDKTYYAYVFLLPSAGPITFNFSNRGFSNVADRYNFSPDTGNAEWTDPQGNRCALVGMCHPVMDPGGPSVASVPYGYPPGSVSPPRWLCSPAPWLHNNAQPLPATTAQAGGSLPSTLAEIHPEYHRIIAVAWAWRGVWSLLNGFAWGDTPGATVKAQIRVKPISVASAGYTTPVAGEATYASAGHRVPLASHNALALDDGAYQFSFWGSVSAGSASYNVTHTLHGWV